MRRWLVPMSVVWLALAGAGAGAQEQTVAEEAPREPLRLELGVRLGGFDMINSPDSYDAVFGSVMPQVGLTFEVAAGRRWLFALSYDYGDVQGERVQLTDPPSSTGLEETLTYQPLALTTSWIFTPEARWRSYAGLGAAIVRWEDKSGGQSAHGDDFGAHVVLGTRSHSGKWSWGGEVRYSQVPDAIGESGISRIFGEDDLGGLALHLVSFWRLR